MNSLVISSYFCWAKLTRSICALAASTGQEPVSRKSRKLLGPEKPFVKLRPAYSVKPVLSYVVKGIKIKITAKFRATRRHPFEDTKRIMSPGMFRKSFGTFEKRAPGLTNVKHTKSERFGTLLVLHFLIDKNLFRNSPDQTLFLIGGYDF